jgi:hypothetical protein
MLTYEKKICMYLVICTTGYESHTFFHEFADKQINEKKRLS